MSSFCRTVADFLLACIRNTPTGSAFRLKRPFHAELSEPTCGGASSWCDKPAKRHAGIELIDIEVQQPAFVTPERDRPWCAAAELPIGQSLRLVHIFSAKKLFCSCVDVALTDRKRPCLSDAQRDSTTAHPCKELGPPDQLSPCRSLVCSSRDGFHRSPGKKACAAIDPHAPVLSP